MAGTAVKRYKKKKKPLNFQLVRVLRELEFKPLQELLVNIYPNLSPKDQMQCVFKVMNFLYPKPKVIDTGTVKKGPGIQTNVQINIPDKEQPQQIQSHEDIVKLLQAAEGKDGE